MNMKLEAIESDFANADNSLAIQMVAVSNISKGISPAAGTNN
jgi:hypothetical protein